MSLDLFENHVGRFWGIVETRDYMLARYSYVQALLQLKTHDAATVAAEHIREMLTLCRKDNLGVRDLLPCTWLRLGRDQDVYDFLKWWATTGRASDYDWGNMDLPHLDVKGADAFEPMDLPDRKHQSLAELMALLLIKVRLVLDLKQLRRAGTEDCKSGRVKLTSSIVEKIVEKELDTSTIEKLEGQVKQLTRRVWETNKYILPACEYPGRHLVAQPPYYSPGSEEEMESVLKYCWNAWEETPGAWEYLKGVAAETKP
jgi:hypothetical protein